MGSPRSLFIQKICSNDPEYRAKSVAHIQKIADLTRRIKPYFPNAKRPKIVIHCGGFSQDEPLPPETCKEYYANLRDSLDQINQDGVELLPENMAPYPWLFGGQRHQNVFVNADEIAAFCDLSGYRICQDLSHSHLACNRYGWDHIKFTEKLAPYTAHYHISDGLGVDGEGVQVDEGTVQFGKLAAVLDKLSPTASFISEVWQGHKNNGEGFWISFERLEKYL
jgi:sugar phosphate isomerase/epimerase